MTEDVIRTKSLGLSAEGVRDQYADGKAAKVWEIFIGDKKSRTENYKNFLVGMLREKGCKKILDVACGTGVDSIMLLEEGFEVTSVDASDKMLKYALKERWSRRREPAFDKWVIEEANWLTLYDDIGHMVGGGFDAVICLGNSFAHMMDNFGDQREQKQALSNFEKCVKPGGLLLIDHRNYDHIVYSGQTPSKCIYYNSSHKTDIKTSVLYEAGKPAMVMMDYFINIAQPMGGAMNGNSNINEFRLSYYPHMLEVFKRMLKEAFNTKQDYKIFGDFKHLNEIDIPNFYIHVVEKK
ncbi:PREDICTED: glycine N-methyltransferase isoform X2 [Nicrophorus vespilloides]|nr:PREDICTED: glycine N-methyltransferase isoform X2 [Nicrophorus vespilloides]